LVVHATLADAQVGTYGSAVHDLVREARRALESERPTGSLEVTR
jgi:hypothetical protein